MTEQNNHTSLNTDDEKYKRISGLNYHWTSFVYWLAADKYENPNRLASVHAEATQHTNINQAMGPLMLVPPAMTGAATYSILQFSSDAKAMGVSAALATGIYVGERMLNAVARKDDEMSAVSLKKSWDHMTKSATLLASRALFATMTAFMVSTGYSTVLFEQEIDQQLRITDRERNAALYDTYDQIAERARAENLALGSDIEALNASLEEEREFFDQIRKGGVDPSSLPAVITLNDVIASRNEMIAGYQEDILKYTDLMQSERLGETAEETMSDGRTVRTSSNGIPGRGTFFNQLNSQREEVQDTIANLNAQIRDYQNERDAIIRDYTSGQAIDNLIAQQNTIIDDLKERIETAEERRAETTATIEEAYRDLRNDPTYLDGFSVTGVLDALDEVKQNSSDTVNNYVLAAGGLVFMLEIAAIALLKLAGTTNVGSRRARRNLVQQSEDRMLIRNAHNEEELEDVKSLLIEKTQKVFERKLKSGKLSEQELVTLAQQLRGIEKDMRTQEIDAVVANAMSDNQTNKPDVSPV